MPLFNINISDPTDPFNNLGLSAKKLSRQDIVDSLKTKQDSLVELSTNNISLSQEYIQLQVYKMLEFVHEKENPQTGDVCQMFRNINVLTDENNSKPIETKEQNNIQKHAMTQEDIFFSSSCRFVPSVNYEENVSDPVILDCTRDSTLTFSDNVSLDGNNICESTIVNNDKIPQNDLEEESSKELKSNIVDNNSDTSF